jgi:hypothetical protein
VILWKNKMSLQKLLSFFSTKLHIFSNQLLPDLSDLFINYQFSNLKLIEILLRGLTPKREIESTLQVSNSFLVHQLVSKSTFTIPFSFQVSNLFWRVIHEQKIVISRLLNADPKLILSPFTLFSVFHEFLSFNFKLKFFSKLNLKKNTNQINQFVLKLGEII